MVSHLFNHFSIVVRMLLFIFTLSTISNELLIANFLHRSLIISLEKLPEKKIVIHLILVSQSSYNLYGKNQIH